MAKQSANARNHDPEVYRNQRKWFAGGAGTYPLIGTPADLSEQMIGMAKAGFAGTMFSFVNFTDEVPPRLEAAGLRA